MKISVVVAVKDNPEVSFCIEAFMRSDYDDKELILVNDCSTDNTKKKLIEYTKKYNNVKTIFNEKNFYSKRNAGD